MQTYTEVLESLTWEERRYFAYLWENMPLSDQDNYPPELFGMFARHAAFLRRSTPWCLELVEPLFLDYVLFHRVNDEDISFHRELFYQALWPRVQSLPLKEAVLEVNRWCGEMASYGQRDARTASPLTVYSSSIGRCGEESAFAVSALRSVGIAARQVYTPRWSHCDDNHAWVEAWCGDGWHFFGACEPEPVLDRGWFNAAASRAVLIHSRRFVKSAGLEISSLHGEALGREGPAVYYNQTKRYADVRRYQFRIIHDNHPVSGAAVKLEILNGAELYPILTLTTDEIGIVSAELGVGSYHLRVRHDLGRAEQLCNGLEQTSFTIHLGSGLFIEQGWHEFKFEAPAGTYKSSPLSDKQKKLRIQQLKWGSLTRTRRREGFFNAAHAGGHSPEAMPLLQAARGNFHEIEAFLSNASHPVDAKLPGEDKHSLRMELLCGLPEKDLTDTDAAVLEDHLQGAARFAGQYSQEIFQEALLSPRIANEKLTSWRSPLSNAYDENKRANYLQKPELLWWDLCETANQEAAYSNLYWWPEYAFRSGRWDDKSRALLFVALLRSWGLPARLHPWDGAPEYWNGEMFCPVELKRDVTLKLHRKPKELLIYRVNWSIARKTEAGWKTLALGEPEWIENMLELRLPIGRYRLLTSVRLPNGNQYAARYDMDLQGDFEMPLYLPRYELKDSLALQRLPCFMALNDAGAQATLPAVFLGREALLLWLLPGEEPTEHILNELLELQSGPSKISSSIMVFLPEQGAAGNPTLKRVLAAYPNMRLFFGDWVDNIEMVSRSLYCDPDSPPLVVCCDSEGNAVYAANGYNVGIVELLVQIMKLLK